MVKHLSPVIIPAVLIIGLASCASPPEVDWNQSQNEASMFIEAATSAEGSLGGGTLRVGQGTPVDTESGIVLNYYSGARITGIRVSCFGEGTLRLGFASQTGSNWSGKDSVEVICNGEENDMSVSEILPMAQVNAVQFNGILGEGTGGVLAVAISGVAN